MKNIMIQLLIALMLTFIFSNCDDSDELEPEVIISIQGVQGVVQKGPFINGTTVTVKELDNDFNATGRSLISVTNNDIGGFEVEGDIKAPYVEVAARGFYYDEVKGDLSSENLSLCALTKSNDPTKTNVNVLTTLTHERIAYLITNEGMDYVTAKRTAQNEVLAAFDIPLDDFINFNILDLSKEGDSNAILLAISIVVQGNRSASEVDDLISSMVADLKEDGELNDEAIKEDLRDNANELNLLSIRVNLSKRYRKLKYWPTIPQFEKFAKRLVPLGVKRTNPAHGEKEVADNLSEIVIEFNKAIDSNTINAESVQIIDSEGNPLSGYLRYDSQLHAAKFALNQQLTPNTTYQIKVSTEIRSYDGKYMEEDFVSEFNSISTNLESGLKAYYTFDGDFADQTGNVADAKGYNIGFSEGKTFENGNQAAKFSGKGSYISMPNVINPTQLNWSYSIWVRIDEKDKITGPFFLGTNMSGRDSWDVPLYFRASSQKFSSYNGGILESDCNMRLKEWYHLLITIDNGSQKMYINGELAAYRESFKGYSEDYDRKYPGFDGEDIGLYNYYDGELYICAKSQTDSNWYPFLTGAVDNVRFYDRPLNKFEVAEIYEQEK
ncbi:hypothetical protein EYV94_18385 [Puteibacter caeruleilacunae]|nr:hypothetical protein EYV94_18385 [Puteibacter caeruleilacunae]